MIYVKKYYGVKMFHKFSLISGYSENVINGVLWTLAPSKGEINVFIEL